MILIPELLAPAGGPKQLIAAVENGADAVYLGGKLFNARQNAANFDDEELKKALEYTHVRGTNAYITLNTLINDEEMGEALEYAGKVYEAGADALIVQDLGFADAVKKQLPDLPLHFSTQATVYNLEGVKVAERLGASRVILARELSLAEIREIANGTSLELEMFVHGALCQCYSGQCYLSSMIGGRSGNRGSCAQPCRLPYTITKDLRGQEAATESAYFLSPKDFCTIEHLDKLVASGVGSLKIEGRMKSPEYVAIVTGIYRRYLDAYASSAEAVSVDPEDLKDLKQIYNRGGFTTGYLFSNPGRELITKERAKHWGTYLGKVTGRNPRKKFVDIRLSDSLSMGDGIEIVSKDMPGNLVTRMLKDGQNAQCGRAGEIITVGYIEGNVKIGDSVYKISDKALNAEAAQTFAGRTLKRIPLVAEFKALAGELLSLSLKDPDGNRVTITSAFSPEPAINKPLTEESAKAQIEKTGASPFEVRNISFEIGENVSVPLSEINAIRRKAIDDLIEIRGVRYPGRKAGPTRPGRAVAGRTGTKTMKNETDTGEIGDTHRAFAPLLSAYLYQWRSQEDIKSLPVDRIYLPLLPRFGKEHLKTIEMLKEKGMQVYLAIPPVTRGEADSRLREQAPTLPNLGIDGLLIGNLGHLATLKDSGLPLIGDYSLNTYNSQSVMTAASLGLQGITLSHELSLSQLTNIRPFETELEVTVYGRVPVMISEHCPIGSGVSRKPDGRSCGLCQKGNYFLKDRAGAVFPVLGDPDSCRATILNKDIRKTPEHMRGLWEAGITSFRLYFHRENREEMERIARLFRRGGAD